MAPPKFGDLGKAAKDLFSDDFGAGEAKLTLKSTASNGVNFKVEGTRAADSGAVNAFVETKFTCPFTGAAIKEKWTTKNVITAEASSECKYIAGSKFTGETTFNPNGGGFSGCKLKAELKKDNAFFEASSSCSSTTVSAVTSFNKFFLGASADYDCGKATVSGHKLTASFVEKDLIVTSSVSNGADVEGSIFHVPREGIQAGVKFAWKKNSTDTCFGLAGRYQIDSTTFVKAKLCKGLTLNLAYNQVVRPGITVGFSSKINAANLQSDAHQLGFSLTLEN